MNITLEIALILSVLSIGCNIVVISFLLKSGRVNADFDKRIKELEKVKDKTLTYGK